MLYFTTLCHIWLSQFPKYVFSMLCQIPLCQIPFCSIPISCYTTFRYTWFQIAHLSVITDSCSPLYLIPLSLIALYLIPVLIYLIPLCSILLYLIPVIPGSLHPSQVVPFRLQYKYATPSMLLHIAVKRVFIARSENAPKPIRERGFKLQWLTPGSIKPRTRVRRETINLRGEISCSNSLLGVAYLYYVQTILGHFRAVFVASALWYAPCRAMRRRRRRRSENRKWESGVGWSS